MACGAGGSIFSVSLSLSDFLLGLSGQALNNEWRRDNVGKHVKHLGRLSKTS
jgi:hypothetical protein